VINNPFIKFIFYLSDDGMAGDFIEWLKKNVQIISHGRK